MSGSVRGAPLHCVVAEVASLTGASVEGKAEDRRVSFAFAKVDVPAALSRILGARSYLLDFRAERLARITLIDGSAPPGAASAGAPRPAREPFASTPSGPADDASDELSEVRRILLDEPNLVARRDALTRLEALPRPPPELIAAVAQQDFDPTMRRRALELATRQSVPDVQLFSAAEVLVRSDLAPEVRAAAAELLRRRAAPAP